MLFINNNYCPRNIRWNFTPFNRLNAVILLSSLGLYAINRWVVMPQCSALWIHCYANDCLATPVLLSGANLWVARFRRPDLLFRSLISVFSMTAIAGAFWEFVAPYYCAAVCDPYDFFPYCLGSLSYYLIVRDNQPPSRPVPAPCPGPTRPVTQKAISSPINHAETQSTSGSSPSPPSARPSPSSPSRSPAPTSPA